MKRITILCSVMLVLSLNSLFAESSGTAAIAPQGKARSIAVAPSRPAFKTLAGKSEIRLSDETLRQMRRGTGPATSQGNGNLVPWSSSGSGMGSKSGPVGPLRKDNIIRPISNQNGDYIPTPEQAQFMAQMRQMLHYNQQNQNQNPNPVYPVNPV